MIGRRTIKSKYVVTWEGELMDGCKFGMVIDSLNELELWRHTNKTGIKVFEIGEEIEWKKHLDRDKSS